MSSMSCARLLQLSLQCATSLNAQRMTVSTHVDEFLKAQGVKDKDQAETIRQIVYGLQRHKKLLSITADGLYAKYNAQISRSDRVLYEIFTLLAVFKLDELGLGEFRLFVLSQEAHKMHALLSFLFTPEMQDGWLKEQWSTVYDPSHIESVLLENMKKHAPQMNAMMSELANTIAHAGAGGATSSSIPGMDGVPKVPKKESTVPEPFSLTQPKVKMLPAPPVQMDAVYKASPVPQEGRSLQELEQEAVKRRQAIEEAVARKHKEARKPKLSTDMRAMKGNIAAEKLRLELEAKERAINQPIKLIPPPPVREVPQPKGTVASILREDVLYRRRLEEKQAELMKYETELRDVEEFHAWQLKMEALDDAAKEEEVRKRKEMSKQSALLAIEAIAKAAEEKHKQVVEIREELRLINQEKEEAKAQATQQKKLLVNKIKEEQQNIPLAVQAVVEQKTKLAEEIQRERAEAAAVVKKNKALELAKRKQLIREIQAMEKLANTRAKRPKEIDPTSTAGFGLLEEMSLVELQARLSTLAEKEEAFLKEKREGILQRKIAKQAVLQEMQRSHVLMRKERKQEFLAAKTQRITTAQEVAQAAKERLERESVILQDHLAATAEMKRIEALRLVKELKAKRIQNEFYSQAKAALAAEREADLLRAKERTIATAAANEAEQERKTALEEYNTEKNRLRVEKMKKREKERVRRQADAVLVEHRQDHAELVEEDWKLKEINRKEIQAAVRTQMQDHRSANPYAKSIADREARRAARLAKKSSDAGEGDEEFLASNAMAEEEERRRIERLTMEDPIGSDDGEQEEEEEEEKTQSSSPPPVRSDSALDHVKQTQEALANITLKRTAPTKPIGAAKTSARGTKAATTKQPLAARA